MRRIGTLIAVGLAVALASPSAALAGASQDFLVVYKAYQRVNGVDGCKFSAARLASAARARPHWAHVCAWMIKARCSRAAT